MQNRSIYMSVHVCQSHLIADLVQSDRYLDNPCYRRASCCPATVVMCSGVFRVPVITVAVLVCVVLAGCRLGAAAECGAEGVL